MFHFDSDFIPAAKAAQPQSAKHLQGNKHVDSGTLAQFDERLNSLN
jgi:hypothetical protein